MRPDGVCIFSVVLLCLLEQTFGHLPEVKRQTKLPKAKLEVAETMRGDLRGEDDAEDPDGGPVDAPQGET